MLLDEKYLRALSVSAQKHDGQYRKFGKKIPSITHPIAVSLMVQKMTDDIDVSVAGLLHDTLEDTDYTEVQMEKDFGKKVTGFVREVTEESKLTKENVSWKERKEAYIRSIKEASYEAMQIALADKVHNLMSLVSVYKEDGDSMWVENGSDADQQIWFHEALATIFEHGLRKEHTEIYRNLITEAKNTWYTDVIGAD